MHDKLYFLLGYLAKLGYVRFVSDNDIELSIAIPKNLNCNVEKDITLSLKTLNFEVVDIGESKNYDYYFKIKNGDEIFNLFIIELTV